MCRDETNSRGGTEEEMNARVVFLGQTDRRDDTRERVKERQREGKGATAPLKGGGNKKGSDG